MKNHHSYKYIWRDIRNLRFYFYKIYLIKNTITKYFKILAVVIAIIHKKTKKKSGNFVGWIAESQK